jgi:redox-sensitive bicupin YhaK (pirin superfamily)
MPEVREIAATTPGMPASDGAGVRMTRIIGTPELNLLDPFLLLDCFESDRPQDYIGGFPSHPHRGFETVTYLLAGRMRHKDNAGNEGVIEPGGVQWMTAGRGIVHSEMPEQEDGLLRGFQLWVNLPARAKMTAPGYQEYPPSGVPLEEREDGTRVRVIAGATSEGTRGVVRNDWVKPTYLDVELPAGAEFSCSSSKANWPSATVASRCSTACSASWAPATPCAWAALAARASCWCPRSPCANRWPAAAPS